MDRRTALQRAEPYSAAATEHYQQTTGQRPRNNLPERSAEGYTRTRVSQMLVAGMRAMIGRSRWPPRDSHGKRDIMLG
jgi:hypothetical protein